MNKDNELNENEKPQNMESENALEIPSLELRDLIQPESVKLREDEYHCLHLSVGEKEYENIRPVKTFPLSSKADYISFIDSRGKEVALVAHPHKLDKESRQALVRALDLMYYVPKIIRIDSINESMGISIWNVLTDRGYATFEIVDRESIVKMPGGRFILKDADGNRFEIEAISELDERSHMLVEGET